MDGWMDVVGGHEAGRQKNPVPKFPSAPSGYHRYFTHTQPATLPLHPGVEWTDTYVLLHLFTCSSRERGFIITHWPELILAFTHALAVN